MATEPEVEVSLGNRSCSEGHRYRNIREAAEAIRNWVVGIDPVEHRDAGPWCIVIDVASPDED